MKLLILFAIVQITLTANTIIISNNKEKMKFSIRGEAPTPIYTPVNTCNNNIMTIGGSNISFDNSCKTSSISSNSVTNSSSGYAHINKYYCEVALITLVFVSF